MKQSGMWSSLGTQGSLVVMWWLCISFNGETGNFDFFKVKFDLDGWGQSLHNRDLNQGVCTSDSNLAIPVWMGDELWCGQAQDWVNLDFPVKFVLEGQGRSLHKKIGILPWVFYTFDLTLVLLACTGHELSRGQTLSDWHTDWHTHTHSRRQQYPKDKIGLG